MPHFLLLLIVLYNIESDLIKRRLQSTHVSGVVLEVWCFLIFLVHRRHFIGRQEPLALLGVLFLDHLDPFAEALLVLFLLGFLRLQHLLVLSSEFLGDINFKVEAMFALICVVIIMVLIEIRMSALPHMLFVDHFQQIGDRLDSDFEILLDVA